MRKLAVFLGAGLAVATLAIPAQATDVTVHLDVDVASVGEIADCDLSVPDGSNGIAVLNQAVEDECIDSYDTDEHPQFGPFVRCINDICGAPDEALNATFWAIYLNGGFSEFGVRDLAVHDGDDLGFNYETWVTCLVAC